MVDASTLRRGKVAANLVWGNKATVLVGDFLFSRAFEMMVDTDSLRVLQILAGASAIIAEGEVMQLKSESNLATTEEHYLKVVGAKTAALFAAAAESGATLCNRGADFVGALRTYGENLGIAFRLVDALDYSGRQALMGKAVGDGSARPRSRCPSSSPMPAPTRRPKSSGSASSNAGRKAKPTSNAPSPLSKRPAPSRKP